MTTLSILRVRLVATSDVTPLSGTGQVIDGVAVAAGDDVLLTNQTTSAQNGVYTASSGAWTRHTDFDVSAEMLFGTLFRVAEGNSDNRGSLWRYDGPDNPTVGTTSLPFTRESYGPGAAITDENTITRDPLTNQWTLKDQFTPSGYFSRVQTDTFGRVQDAVQEDIETTFIEGLKIVYESAASITVEAGNAYIPGEGGVIELEADTTLSGLALTANTWYSVYLYEVGGVGAIEVVTQGPESIPYLGNARIKGPDGAPDASRRYLGAIRAIATNTMMRFRKEGNLHMHLGDWNTLASSGGLKIHDSARISATNNTPLDTDLSPLVPPHCRVAEVQGRLIWVSAASTAWFRHSENTTKTRYIGTVTSNVTNSSFTMLVETDSARHIQAVQDSGAAADIILACTGFVEELA